MKLSFNKKDLLNAIETVQSSISTKSTLPILSNLLIKTSSTSQKSSQKVEMEATDLEVGVRRSVKAEVLEEGSMTVPAKKLGEIVREAPDGREIELVTTNGKRVEFKCGKVRAVLPGLSPENFPIIPEFQKTGSFQLGKNLFRDMIRKTSFAVSLDETRRALNGVFFEASVNYIKMVATDGRRVSLISCDNSRENINTNAIIPSRAIGELSRLLSLSEEMGEDSIQISVSTNQISFKWMDHGEEVVLVSRIIDEDFPNYEQVIPKVKEIELKVKTSEILSSVKRAALFAQDRGGSIRFSLKGGLLKISANSNVVGEEEEELDVNYNGQDFEIAFNPNFLLDVLKNNNSPEICFEFSSPLNPGVIRPSDNDRYQCVIMPMRLQQ